MKAYEQSRMIGEHANESDCWAEFDATMQTLEQYFVVHREVTGWYTQGRPHCQPKRPRIDRIISPREPLRALGWDLGPVGVECKRSHEKAGPAISQAIDYQRALFPISGSLTVSLEWVFIWPMEDPKGDIASIMSNQRIGFMSPLADGITFGCGDGFIQRVTTSGVRYRRPQCGYKVGSR